MWYTNTSSGFPPKKRITFATTKGAMGFSQRIHPELITKIQELVSTGITDPVVVQRLLRQHVLNTMCASNHADPN